MKFIISCGGTGGHLAPGISLAESLMERGHNCILVISHKEVDSRLTRKYSHLDFVKAPGRAFSLHPIMLAKFIASQFSALAFALRFLRDASPDIIFGFGGFITANVGLVGYILNIPVVLHEANRKPGKAVRYLSIIAKRIYLPQGVKLKKLFPKPIRHFGYPVRKGIKKLKRERCRSIFGFNMSAPLLLVMGGSQGAVALNNWTREHFTSLAEEGIHVCCLTGLQKGNAGVLEHVNKSGNIIKAHFIPFCDDMAELLSSADLVVARAGAGSIAEFTRCQLPSILIPLPSSADNHQVENARYHERRGCALLLFQENIDKLETEVKDVISNIGLLGNMQMNLRRLDTEHSLELIVDDLESLFRDGDPTRSFQPKTKHVA